MSLATFSSNVWSWAIYLVPWCLALLLGITTFAAGDPVSANLLHNPGFEEGSHSEDNLWDGVNSDGALTGFASGAPVVLDDGSFGRLAMPPSVAFVDLNGDSKADLITAEPSGYFRFYPNRGTAQTPKFTSAEILPIFLPGVPRFALADWRNSGLMDLLIGNYLGEVLFLQNIGTPKTPVFRQPLGPKGMASARLATSATATLWGNLLSPAALDLNRDGQLDLVVGEGTYSANSIHLLRNLGHGGLPKFNDGNHLPIAYGDGREQLIPTAVDYDGDGYPDLLVADRTGEVGVYLNPGKSQPVGAEFKRVSTLSFGGQGKLPGLCSIYAADFNGDGLFDLLIGLPSGHIAVALNAGTKGNPQFRPLQELQGEGHFGRNINLPDGWEADTSSSQGNALSYITVVDAKADPGSQPPEGKHCLKAGYWPLNGETFQIPPEGMPGVMKRFVLAQPNITLQTNRPYEVSFRAKGGGMEKLHYKFTSHYRGLPDFAKIERGERGEMRNTEAIVEEGTDIGEDFTLSSNWSTVSGALNVRYKHNELRSKSTMTGTLSIEFWATSLSSMAYFDNFKITPK